MEQSKTITYRLKICTVMLWIILLASVISSVSDYDSIIFEIGFVRNFTTNVFLTAFIVIGSYYPRLVKYFTMCTFLQRCVSVYVMLKLIDSTELTERTDKKFLTDSISIIFIPWFALCKFNPKVDLFLVPLVLVANSATIVASLDKESGSMNCFR